MNIIIPMAGMGKRMRPHTLTLAKPLIPIAGKPIVQRLVEDIMATCNARVNTIAFIISPTFGKEVETQLIQIAENLGAEGRIFYQEEALGTAHAILCARTCLNDNVFIAFADTLFDAKFEIDLTKDAIVWTQKVEDPSAFGVVKLGVDNRIEAFVEKPSTFVSDLAIIGIYYFKDGPRLEKELQRLIDENIVVKGEYQITDAMDHMLNNGVAFYTDQVSEWLDCGNKNATVETNARMLVLKSLKETLVHASAQLHKSHIIEPCYIGENVVIKNAVVGPFVSIESGAVIEDARIENSIIMNNAVIKHAVICNSMIGKHAEYSLQPMELSLGDYSTTNQ